MYIISNWFMAGSYNNLSQKFLVFVGQNAYCNFHGNVLIYICETPVMVISTKVQGCIISGTSRQTNRQIRCSVTYEVLRNSPAISCNLQQWARKSENLGVYATTVVNPTNFYSQTHFIMEENFIKTGLELADQSENHRPEPQTQIINLNVYIGCN